MNTIHKCLFSPSLNHIGLNTVCHRTSVAVVVAVVVDVVAVVVAVVVDVVSAVVIVGAFGAAVVVAVAVVGAFGAAVVVAVAVVAAAKQPCMLNLTALSRYFFSLFKKAMKYGSGLFSHNQKSSVLLTMRAV